MAPFNGWKPGKKQVMTYVGDTFWTKKREHVASRHLTLPELCLTFWKRSLRATLFGFGPQI